MDQEVAVRLVTAVGEAGARELLDVLIRPEADRPRSSAGSTNAPKRIAEQALDVFESVTSERLRERQAWLAHRSFEQGRGG